jgi:hypothetical protein
LATRLIKWVKKKAQSWADGVIKLSMAAGRHPQAAHCAGFQKSLHQEWQFPQQVTSGLSNEFRVVDKVLNESCLPSPFGNRESCNAERQLACHLGKHAGLALSFPSQRNNHGKIKLKGINLDSWTPRCCSSQNNRVQAGIRETASHASNPQKEQKSK